MRIIRFPPASIPVLESSTYHSPRKKTQILWADVNPSFAWAEMRMIAANLLSRFDVVEVSGQDVDFRQYITMQFSTGHWKAIIIPRRPSTKATSV